MFFFFKCASAGAKLRRTSAPSATTEPSGVDGINPPTKKSTTKELSSKIFPPRVINKLTSGAKPVSQGAPHLRIKYCPCLHIPTVGYFIGDSSGSWCSRTRSIKP